jgi:hypothetical protein
MIAETICASSAKTMPLRPSSILATLSMSGRFVGRISPANAAVFFFALQLAGIRRGYIGHALVFLTGLVLLHAPGFLFRAADWSVWMRELAYP